MSRVNNVRPNTTRPFQNPRLNSPASGSLNNNVAESQQSNRILGTGRYSSPQPTYGAGGRANTSAPRSRLRQSSSLSASAPSSTTYSSRSRNITNRSATSASAVQNLGNRFQNMSISPSQYNSPPSTQGRRLGSLGGHGRGREDERRAAIAKLEQKYDVDAVATYEKWKKREDQKRRERLEKLERFFPSGNVLSAPGPNSKSEDSSNNDLASEKPSAVLHLSPEEKKKQMDEEKRKARERFQRMYDRDRANNNGGSEN